MEIEASPAAGITLKPFNFKQFPAFGEIITTSPALNDAQPASFVVDNGSDRAIIGIAVQWIFITPSGEQNVYSSRTHSFLSAKAAPLVAPHGRMFVAPQVFIPEAAVTSGGLIGTVPPARIVAQLQSASSIHVRIDSIIFADGEVVGPNRLNLPGEIQDRKIAADLITRHVHAARTLGKDPIAALHDLPASPSPWGSGVDKHRSQFASQLSSTKHFDAVLSFIEAIPAPPKFFRKDGSPL
jgi:hypothetical protein